MSANRQVNGDLPTPLEMAFVHVLIRQKERNVRQAAVGEGTRPRLGK